MSNLYKSFIGGVVVGILITLSYNHLSKQTYTYGTKQLDRGRKALSYVDSFNFFMNPSDDDIQFKTFNDKHNYQLNQIIWLDDRFYDLYH